LEGVGRDGIYKMCIGFNEFGASTECRLAYCIPDQEPRIFIGRTRGTIVIPRGDNKFGWDFGFCPEGYDQTYTELPAYVRNQISHRAKALEAFKEFILSNPSWI
jgi:inosine triphosphate pyrophosphatase